MTDIPTTTSEPAAAPATTLYPDPAPAGAETTAAPESSSETTIAPGPDTIAAPEGTDTIPGADTSPGTDTQPGTDSVSPPDYTSLTLPEGMIVDDNLFGEFKAEAAEAKLDPDSAQKFLAIGHKLLTAQNEANLATFTATQNQWLAEVNAFPEFTGAEAREQSLASIGRVLDEFGTPEVRQLMDLTGAGNNPAMVRMLLNISKALNEGMPTPQGRPAIQAGPKSLGDRLYPKS